jgi:hypothetical protein
MTLHHKYRNAILASALLLGLTALTAGAQAQAPSPKKGFGVVVRPDGVWKKNVTALRVRWFYSWGGDEPADLPAGVKFVPMDWGYYGNKDDSLVKWLAKVKAQPGITTLLGFNEPDGKDQANLSVDRALEGWPYLEQTGLRLGSPAAVHPDGDWMKAFMAGAEAKHYRVDFITIHWYGGADPQGFLDMLARVHALYQRPLWVTEFAPADWNTSPGHPNRWSPAQVAAFMRVVLPEMNRRTYVQRYAWFSASPDDAALGTSALLNKDGSLTDLGRLYAAL